MFFFQWDISLQTLFPILQTSLRVEIDTESLAGNDSISVDYFLRSYPVAVTRLERDMNPAQKECAGIHYDKSIFLCNTNVVENRNKASHI